MSSETDFAFENLKLKIKQKDESLALLRKSEALVLEREADVEYSTAALARSRAALDAARAALAADVLGHDRATERYLSAAGMACAHYTPQGGGAAEIVKAWEEQGRDA